MQVGDTSGARCVGGFAFRARDDATVVELAPPLARRARPRKRRAGPGWRVGHLNLAFGTRCAAGLRRAVPMERARTDTSFGRLAPHQLSWARAVHRRGCLGTRRRQHERGSGDSEEGERGARDAPKTVVAHRSTGTVQRERQSAWTAPSFPSSARIGDATSLPSSYGSLQTAHCPERRAVPISQGTRRRGRVSGGGRRGADHSARATPQAAKGSGHSCAAGASTTTR
jgi:hypothetical protein